METTQEKEQQERVEASLGRLGKAVFAAQQLHDAALVNKLSIDEMAEFVVTYAKRIERTENEPNNQ